MEYLMPDVNSGQFKCKTEIETDFGHCRCCLEEGHHRDISKRYLADGKQEIYCDIFLECFNLFLSTNTNLSTLICTSCVCRLREAYNFKSQVMRMEYQLMEALHDCRGEQMVLVNVPVAKDTLDTTVGFKIEVNDVEESKPCNLADKMFVIQEIIPEVRQDITNKPLEKPNEQLNEIPPTANDLPSEKMALIDNICTLLNHCNATLFKSKTRAGFPCFYCKELFDNFDVLREHQTEHPRYILKNTLEKYTADSLVVHADVTDLKCTICVKHMKSLKELKSHLTVVHEMAFNPKLTDRVVPFKFLKSNYFECQICTFNFETYRAIERHMNTHFRNYVCNECGAGFVTSARQRVHMKTIHREGVFPCERCGRIFITHNKYKCHVDFVHKMLKKLKCHTCSERFSDYFVMKKHMVMLHGEKPISYKCNVCFKSFSRKYNLACHMRRHLHQKNVRCEICAYACYTKSELKEHMLKHKARSFMGEFGCSICGRSYLRKRSLLLHLKSHPNSTTEQ